MYWAHTQQFKSLISWSTGVDVLGTYPTVVIDSAAGKAFPYPPPLPSAEYVCWYIRPMILFIIKYQFSSYSITRRDRTWIPRNHVFLEHILFPLLSFFLFLFKIYAFVEQIRRFNTDSLNFSPLFTNKKTPRVHEK